MTKAVEKPQLDLFRTDVSWFHIFKELIRSKAWAEMTTSAKALYPVIKSFINWQDGTAFPSIDTLQEYSGLARASVVKALKELEQLGLLQKAAGQGRKSSNYRVVEKFAVTDEAGRPTASVSFDYLPAYVGNAVAELKNFIAEGLSSPGGGAPQFIKIEHLTLNIVHGNQQNFTVNDDRLATLKGLKDMLAKRATPEAAAILEQIEGLKARKK